MYKENSECSQVRGWISGQQFRPDMVVSTVIGDKENNIGLRNDQRNFETIPSFTIAHI